MTKPCTDLIETTSATRSPSGWRPGPSITVPLLVLAARSGASRPYVIAAAAVTGLTAAEVGWALAYLVAGEASQAGFNSTAIS